ncbi:MAG: type IV pilin-like G/H family protein [Crocosphaera sp.]
MKTEFKAKFLQHVAKKRKEEGFTLIELLVVIIIIGILSAIALPSFLNQANKAKQSEARTYVGSMNRAQQSNFLEKTKFTTDINALGLGILTQTTNYKYGCGATDVDTGGLCTATANSPVLRGYYGSVFTLTAGTNETTTSAIVCEMKDAGAAPDGTAGAQDCGDNTPLGE